MLVEDKLADEFLATFAQGFFLLCFFLLFVDIYLPEVDKYLVEAFLRYENLVVSKSLQRVLQRTQCDDFCLVVDSETFTCDAYVVGAPVNATLVTDNDAGIGHVVEEAGHLRLAVGSGLAKLLLGAYVCEADSEKDIPLLADDTDAGRCEIVANFVAKHGADAPVHQRQDKPEIDRSIHLRYNMFAKIHFFKRNLCRIKKKYELCTR